jgi:capsular exopolysaccharide synthesis family protein
MIQDKSQGIDIRAWITRLLKNWYWFVASCAVFMVIGLYVFFSTPNEFEVKAEIMLRDEDNGSAFMQTEMLSMMGMGGLKLVDDEIAILTSRDIIANVISDLNLQFDYRKKDFLKWRGQYPASDLSVACSPLYLDTLTRPVSIEVKVRDDNYVVKVKYGKRQSSKHVVSNLSESIETCAGILSLDINNPKAVETGNQYRIKIYPLTTAVNIYRNKVHVSAAKKDSKIIQISSITDIPSRAKNYIGRLVELYNYDAIVDKNMMANNTADFINERLRMIEGDLMQAEERAAQYQAKYGILDPEVEAELFLTENMEYRKQLAEIETQLNWINFLCDFMKEDANKDYLLPTTFTSLSTKYQHNGSTVIPSGMAGTDMALMAAIEEYNSLMLKRMRLERTLKAENPLRDQMDEQLVVLRANIIGSVENLQKALLISKQDYEKHFELASKKRSDMPDQVRNYEKMLREKEFLERMYLFICQQREENAMLMAAAVVPAKMVTKPQSDYNIIRPHLKMILLLCMMLGLVFPVGMMIVYDILNNRISHDAKELEKRIKIPFAGVLVKNHRGEHIAVREGENSVSAELFRTLRTNMSFMQPSTAKTPIVLVTSSINGEGKSYVATNLAISMTLLGKKVALVGLDIRKPMLASYLDLPTNGSLTSYLADSAYDIDDIIVSTNITRLDVIPAGIIPPNPSELLQSNRLDELFVELRNRYDYIVVDSAPVAMVSDTFLLSRLVDMTVYVTRANYTTFELVDFLNQTHEQQRLPKMVAVLNGVDAKKIGYGYGYGYGQNVKSTKR